MDRAHRRTLGNLPSCCASGASFCCYGTCPGPPRRLTISSDRRSNGARLQGALSCELRAATSLTRLLRDRDRIDEARDLLAPSVRIVFRRWRARLRRPRLPLSKHWRSRRFACLSNVPRRPWTNSNLPTPMLPSSPTSAASSTEFRWQSSWRPPVSTPLVCGASRGTSTTGFSC